MSQPDPLGVQRGDYGRNISANLLFTVGRVLTGPAQYFLIASRPLSCFGVPPPPTGAPSITLMGHTFPRLPFLTALMPGVLSAKHLVWANLMMRERMTLKFATFAIISDFMYEAIGSTIFTSASVNPMWSERYFYTGFTIFMASAAVELLAELQRIAFKAKKENRGKVCKSGFWAITRHINYTANVLFGFGYGLATGGPLYSLATAGMYISNFTINAMPSIERYCQEKYMEQWTQYEREVPWQLFPGIY